MPGPSPSQSPSYDQDPLIRILAEMLDSALKWEIEHLFDDPSPQNRLTEESADIHLVTTDLLPTDADSETEITT